MLQRFIDKLLSNFALQLIQILLLGFLQHIRMHIVLHLGHLVSHVSLELPELLLGKQLEVEFILLGITVEDDAANSLYMLFGQLMQLHRELLLLLSGHRLRFAEFSRSRHRLFLLLLDFAHLGR